MKSFIDLKVLAGNVEKLMLKYKNYDFKFLVFSLEDVKSNKTKN